MKYTKYVTILQKIKKKYNILHCVRYRIDECLYRIDYIVDLNKTIQWFKDNKKYTGPNSLSGLLRFTKYSTDVDTILNYFICNI